MTVSDPAPVPWYYRSLDFEALWREFPPAPDYLASTYLLSRDAMRALQNERFLRQMDRGIASLDFDSARWMAQFPGPAPAERARVAQQLLLATAPQQRPDYDADSRTYVHALVLDAAYQLK